MHEEKLEPRLRETIEQQQRRAPALHLTAEEISTQPLEVIIAHQERLEAPEAPSMLPADRVGALEDLHRHSVEAQSPIIDRLSQLGVDTSQTTSHTLANAVTASLSPVQLGELTDLDEVELIRLAQPDYVETMHESVHVIEAREAAEAFHLNGRGIRVAVLDSGIDDTHPALAGKVVDAVSMVAEPIHIHGAHGTHVAGTVASNDQVFRGVAPQADLLDIKVLTASGFGTPQGVIDGLEQAVRRGAGVVNLSLGWSESLHGWVCDDADCVLCEAADNASRLGVTVVVAAGNEGASAQPPANNVRHPSAARRAITVGALDKAKKLAAFSSRGPGSGRLSPGSPIRLTKPDVAAPGVGITSTVPGGGFAAFNGTSMASPHVAGLAALVLQKNGDLTPLMVKKLLEDTCEEVHYGPNEAGYGLVNALGAGMRTVSVK